MSRVLTLTLAYDGTDFSGWQRQLERRTVQAVIEDALRPMASGDLTAIAAGRTDAGVHAAGQVVSVAIDSALSIETLQRALNATLPPDVRVLAIAEAPTGFDARRAARVKTYHYAVWNAPALPPHARRLTWHVAPPLDLDAMNRAAAHLVGRHDFAAFQSAGGTVTRTTRHLASSVWREVDWGTDALGVFGLPADGNQSRLLRYEVTGSGFLRHMVRSIVGTLVEVGLGRWSPDDVVAVLASCDRARAGPTAPPHGLTLWRVDY